MGIGQSKRMGPRGLTLAWGWLALDIIYISWGSFAERGLYGWLMRWQIERSDGYSGALTFALPMVLLALPSIWVLLGHFEAVEADVLGDPERERAYFRRWALAMLGLAGLSFVTAVACGALAAIQPGYEPQTEIEAAELIAGRARDGHLAMRARPELAARYEVSERGRFGRSNGRSWAGYRLEGEPVGTGLPIALFSEGYTSGRRSGEHGRLGDTVQISGYPVLNGLPEEARRGLEARGVRLAEPHYVLRRAPEGTDWMVGFGVALFGAFILGFIGGVLLLRSEGKLGPRSA